MGVGCLGWRRCGLALNGVMGSEGGEEVGQERSLGRHVCVDVYVEVTLGVSPSAICAWKTAYEARIEVGGCLLTGDCLLGQGRGGLSEPPLLPSSLHNPKNTQIFWRIACPISAQPLDPIGATPGCCWGFQW